MAKRFGENLQNDSKKQKLDDTFWDDDLDDDCFGELASRLLEQNEIAISQQIQSQSNVSILPSYESFSPQVPFASTQDHFPVPSNIPQKSTTGGNGLISEELRTRINYLEQKCESKEGEVAILRAQLQKMKSETMNQNSNRYREYLEKTQQKEKELKNVKDQLEFKNLEIANLKQRISDISKGVFALPNNDNSNKRPRVESSFKQAIKNSVDSPRKIIKNDTATLRYETNILEGIDYPLVSKFSPDFFQNSPPEVHILESKSNQHERNAIPYLHNQRQEECIVPSGPKITVRMSSKEVGFEYIYPDIIKIIKGDCDKINSEENKSVIRNILSMSIQLLHNFKQYLEKLEKHYRTEDIEQIDKAFLQNNYSKFSCAFLKENEKSSEIGVRASKTIEFIAEVLPLNCYLADFIILGKSINFEEQILLSIMRLNKMDKEGCYLYLLSDIVRKIFYLRKTGVCFTFLNSVAALLLSISKTESFENIFPVFTDLISLLLFTKPPTDVLRKLLIIFRNCAKSVEFLNFLCQKPESIKYVSDKKRKIQCFNEDSCKFALFVALYKTGLKNIEDEMIHLEITSNVLSLIYNIFVNNSFWMHEQQKDECNCLEQLYQLAIEVSYKSVLRYKNNQKTSLKDDYYSLFKFIATVLELLCFNSFNLMETNIESYARYQEICRCLMEFKDIPNFSEEIDDLEKLNLSEEVSNIEPSSFDLL